MPSSVKLPCTPVCTRRQRDDLDRHAQRMTRFANAAGLSVVAVIKEVGFPGERHPAEAHRLVAGGLMRHVINRAHDRLSRVGFGWFDVPLGLQARRIVVAAAATEEKADLLDAFVSIIASFCCSLVRAAVGATQDRGDRRFRVGPVVGTPLVTG